MVKRNLSEREFYRLKSDLEKNGVKFTEIHKIKTANRTYAYIKK